MANEHSQIVPSMQPTSTVADFKFWCQKVLPLVYDDSLSYYEVLNKMVVYLNQVIDNINADTANVAELEDDFLLLQTYVNNFFDDIDQLVTYTERAEAAQTAAASSAISAATSASNAATSASNSAGSASSAAASALSALDAKDAAVAAKTAAEAALANAQTAATNAAASATAAGNSATAASGSATNAAASAASALQNFQLSDAARVAAQSAAEDAETAAETFTTDTTLSVSGKAADAKVTGDEISALKTAMTQIADTTNATQITETASGNPATFSDGADGAYFKSIIADINFTQSGSGDPSPSNIRPISGKTGLTLSVYGNDENNPDTYNVTWETEAGTVYSGYVDIVTGTLTINAKLLTATDDGEWRYDVAGGSYGYVYYRQITIGTDSTKMRCNIAPVIINMTDLGYARSGTGLIQLYVNAIGITSLAEWKTYVRNHTVQFLYPLPENITYQIPQTEVKQLIGTNNVASDSGTNVSVSYIVNPEEYFSRAFILDKFDGDTLEDKLFNALDSVTSGVIRLYDNVVINNPYRTLNKDYRKIMLCGGQLTLNCDGMFTNNSGNKGMTVPSICNCVIIGNGHKLLINDVAPSVTPITALSQLSGIAEMNITACVLDNVRIMDTTISYIQSLHLSNCYITTSLRLLRAAGFWALNISNCVVNGSRSDASAVLIESTFDENTYTLGTQNYVVYHANFTGNVFQRLYGTINSEASVFKFGKATDVRFLNNYFEHNTLPIVKEYSTCDVFDFVGNFVNEYDSTVQEVSTSDKCLLFSSNVPTNVNMSRNKLVMINSALLSDINTDNSTIMDSKKISFDVSGAVMWTSIT